MVEEHEMAARACSGPRLHRGTSLVTTVHVLKAGFAFLSQVVGGDGVLCRVVSCRVVCVCSLFMGLLCGGVRFGELCTNCYFFLNDIAVPLLLFQKKTTTVLPYPFHSPGEPPPFFTPTAAGGQTGDKPQK
jgi:hypothetical protein